MKRSIRGSYWLVAALALGIATPSGATTDVIQRSFENMPQGITDALLSPVTAGQSVYNNLNTIEDTTGVRVAYTVPGYFWNVMCNFGGGLIRTITGVIELPTGLFLLFSDAEMEPLFDPVEDNEALISFDQFEDVYRVKTGISYSGGG
jgi:hypothetical protein